MADYTQPPVMEKRVRFFDGQFLQDQDFVDEQKYHLDRERRQSRLLHVTGVVDGLRVSPARANQILVTRGSAVDSLGRQLVLADDRTVDLPAAKFNNQQGVSLYILYQETPVDLATTGSKSERRWLEKPQIVAATTGGESTEPWDNQTVPVLLARLNLDNNGSVTVDDSVTQYAGLSLPGNVGIGTAEPGSFKLNVQSGSTNLGGGLTVRGSTDLEGNTFAHGNLQVDGSSAFAGNVGIGTTEPKAKLSFSNVDGSTEPIGITWQNPNPTDYGIHRTAGDWTAPNYQQLRLSWRTGIILDPGTQYAKSYVDVQGGGLRVTSGDLKWGNQSQLKTDQGGSIELGGNNDTAGGGTPYIDFHYDGKKEDFNTRIINDGDGRLTLIASTYLQMQGPVLFKGNVGINTGGIPSQKLRVDGNIFCSGNVGINVDTPTERLAVNGNIYCTGNVGIGTTGPGAKLDVRADATTAGGWYEAIRFSQAAHSAITHPGSGLLFGLHSDRSFYFADIAGGAFQKYVLAIKADTGYVGIGLTNPGYPLHIKGGPWTNFGGATSFVPFGLYVEANVAASEYHRVSDARIKLNPLPVDPLRSLKTLMDLTLYEYEYRPEYQPFSRGKRYHGFLAQEVEKVIPEAVSIVGDQKLGADRVIEGLRVLASDRIFSESVGAIQALYTLLQEQETRIRELEGQPSGDQVDVCI